MAHDEEAGRSPRWGVSAFGSAIQDGETEDDAVKRICEQADKNGNTVAVFSVEDLHAIGFGATLDEPPPGHYLLGEGNLEKEPDYAALSSLLDEHRRKNPVRKERTR